MRNDSDSVPVLDPESAREYSESLSRITEGWWGQMAWAFKQGIPEALGMSRREWAESYHGYLKLPIPERREAVAELAAEGFNNSQIADALGVSKQTVARDIEPEVPNGTLETGLEPEALAADPALVGDVPDATPALTPEEREARLREQERREAVERAARRLEGLVTGWLQLENLGGHAFRDDILLTLNGADREKVLQIETIYEKGTA